MTAPLFINQHNCRTSSTELNTPISSISCANLSSLVSLTPLDWPKIEVKKK